jgi:mRNA interferase RelE/StbE
VRTAYRKRFLKDLAAIPSQTRGRIEVFAFEEALQLASLAESGKIEKLKGSGAYYRIRFGDYRVGSGLKETPWCLRERFIAGTFIGSFPEWLR